MIAITQRCIQLLKLICENPGPVTARGLSAVLKVSERTVRYDLALLTDWLAERQVELKSAPKKGVYLPGGEKEKAEALLREYRENQREDDRFLNAEERMRMIVTDILEGKSSWSFDEAPELFRVSRTTFARDLEKAEEWLHSHGARLLRKQKRGVRLDADEAERRRLIVEFIRENVDKKALTVYFMTYERDKEGKRFRPSTFLYINQVFSRVDLGELITQTDRHFKTWGISVSDDEFIDLIYYQAVMVSRVQEGHCLEALPEQYRAFADTEEYSGICAMLQERLPGQLSAPHLELEAAYLCARISAARGGERIHPESNSAAARQISTFLLAELERRLNCSLSGDVELTNALRTHLQAAIVRIHLNMPAQNAMLEETKRKFPELFAACIEIAEEIYRKFGIRFDEREVGFITMYTAVALQKEKECTAPGCIRAVLICGYGIGTVSFLTESIRRQFSSITIVDKLSIFDIYEFDFSRTDLVFTTIDIPLPLPKPMLKVNPILTRLDIRRIDSFLRTRGGTVANTTREFRVNELLSIIRKHCDIKDGERLAAELKTAIESYSDRPRTLSELPALLDVLSRKHVVAHIEAADWNDAVRQAAQPLLDSGCTTQDYVDEIISIKDQYGQYSVLSGGVCMPHASPSMFYKLSLSLATLKEPLEIQLADQTVKLYVVMVLSLSDTMTQAKVLDELFSMLDEFPDMGAELQKAASAEELCRMFKSYYDRLF